MLPLKEPQLLTVMPMLSLILFTPSLCKKWWTKHNHHLIFPFSILLFHLKKMELLRTSTATITSLNQAGSNNSISTNLSKIWKEKRPERRQNVPHKRQLPVRIRKKIKENTQKKQIKVKKLSCQLQLLLLQLLNVFAYLLHLDKLIMVKFLSLFSKLVELLQFLFVLQLLL